MITLITTVLDLNLPDKTHKKKKKETPGLKQRPRLKSLPLEVQGQISAYAVMHGLSVTEAVRKLILKGLHSKEITNESTHQVNIYL